MTTYLQLLTMLLGVGSAILTGVIAHANAPGQFKSLLNLLLSLGVGAIEQGAQTHGPFTWHGWLTATALAFAAGTAAHESQLIGIITGDNGLLAKYLPGGIGGVGTALLTALPRNADNAGAPPVVVAPASFPVLPDVPDPNPPADAVAPDTATPDTVTPAVPTAGSPSTGPTP